MSQRFYVVEPEVAGGLGDQTVMDRAHTPPQVTDLHYAFDGWQGDALLETFPCFIATEELVRRLGEIGITGFVVRTVTISTSETFEELQPETKLPPFRWLDITGTASKDDAGLARDGRLVVSDRLLREFQRSGLEHALIEELPAATAG